MQVIAHLQKTNLVGKTYDIAVRQQETGYYIARSLCLSDNYGRGRTAEEAIATLESIVDHNHPAAFDLMPEEKQKQLIGWVREFLLPGTRGKSKRYSSYYLKHVAERALGWPQVYVGNGEMKGALLKAGYKPSKDTCESWTNWNFVLQRGLPEKIDEETYTRMNLMKPDNTIQS